MPTYNSAAPPLALFPGDVGFSFNNEAFPANGTAGAQFALPLPAGFPEQTHRVRWQTLFTGGPTAVNITLQAALEDVDADYKDVDTSTQTAGEQREISVAARFIRAKMNSRTGGTNLTMKFIV